MSTTKISALPITIRSIDKFNSISTSYYDHGRAATIEAILANIPFSFIPGAKNIQPMYSFYLAHLKSVVNSNYEEITS